MKYFYTLEELAEVLKIQLENMQFFYQQGYLGKGINVGLDAQKPDIRFTYEDVNLMTQNLRKKEDSLDRPVDFELFVGRINLKSSGVDPGGYCLKNYVGGCGWSVTGFDPNIQEVDDFGQYSLLADAQYGVGEWNPVIFLKNLPIGSVLWTRHGHRGDTKFYIGLVTGNWKYINTPEAKAADIVNVRPCLWYKIGGYDSVIQEVQKAFTPATIAKVKNNNAVSFTKKIVMDLVLRKIWPDIIGLNNDKDL